MLHDLIYPDENVVRFLTNEVLDSFDVICIIGELSTLYSIEIDMDDVSEDYFNSIDGIIQMVQNYNIT